MTISMTTAPNTGSLLGTVTDSVTNQPLLGAQVTVFNAGNQIIWTTIAGVNGDYSINNSLETTSGGPNGAGCTDSVQFSANGYMSTTPSAVVINTGQTTTLNATLHQ